MCRLLTKQNNWWPIRLQLKQQCNMSATMVFRCCVMQQSTQSQPQAARKRRHIDRSMIGTPTNFQHTGHIGSADVGGATSQVDCTRMQTKGGYCESSSVVSHLKLVDLPASP